MYKKDNMLDQTEKCQFIKECILSWTLSKTNKKQQIPSLAPSSIN